MQRERAVSDAKWRRHHLQRHGAVPSANREHLHALSGYETIGAMRNLLLLSIAMTFGACGGDDGGSDVPDANSGPVCSGAAYETCADNADCDSQNCHEYAGAGLKVCTQTCDATNPCPMQNGVAVQCNGMGICRPDAASACTAP